jgi:hypothetical protein
MAEVGGGRGVGSCRCQLAATEAQHAEQAAHLGAVDGDKRGRIRLVELVGGLDDLSQRLVEASVVVEPLCPGDSAADFTADSPVSSSA